MKGVDFPLVSTKVPGHSEAYRLNDPDERAKYFERKVGAELKKLRAYLADKTFVGYMLGKKNSGKGTYAKLFQEALGGVSVGHVSIGDVIRDAHTGLADPQKKGELVAFLEKNYRGFHSVDELVGLIEGRDQSSLISTELVVALLKYEISKRPRTALFIDGFPRGLDQVSHAMFLRELLGYRDDPDFFVFIDLPEAIIDERIKYRVICPICKTPRNTKLLATKSVEYDVTTGKFVLLCDTPTCNKARMVPKEGDEFGIEPIRARLETDDAIFGQLLKLTGVPKVMLRNSIPADAAAELVDSYEVTPAYDYAFDAATKTVSILEKPWTVNDDNGVASNSLLPAAVVVSMVRQIAGVLGL